MLVLQPLRAAQHVLHECRGGDQQLRIHRAHHRRENARDHDAGEPRRQQLAGQSDEDGLRIREISIPEVQASGRPDGNRGRSGKRHPDQIDAPRAAHRRRAVDGHEARQHVRLPEVAEPPRQRADQCQGAGRHQRPDLRHRAVHCARRVMEGERRHHRQRQQHQQRLEEVGPADGQEPAERRVDEHHGHAAPQRHRVVQPQHRLEQLGASDETGRRVHREEEQHQQRGHQRRQARLRGDPPSEELRQRDRA